MVYYLENYDGPFTVFYDLVIQLLKRFDRLSQSCHEFSNSIKSDQGLPWILPTFDGPEALARKQAAQSLTQLWHPDAGNESLEAGLLCCSKTTLQLAEQLNQHKSQFQAIIMEIRKHGTGDKTRVDKLVERVLQKEGRRTDELSLALKQAGINRLDLLKCYAKIRVLPPNLRSISWTWAKTHSAIVSITHKEAVELAQNLTNPKAMHTALSLLSNIPSGEKLAMKKKLPNQLRANLVWLENEIPQRKAVTISGIVLSQDPKLPKFVWRENPDANENNVERLTRWDTQIDATVYIRALNIHRYLKQP